MEDLKPCPFCGSAAETCSYYFEEGDMTLWQVRCKERPCKVEHPCYTADSFISFATEAEAIEAWNTRAERTCRIYETDHEYEDSVRCSACRMTFNRPWDPFKYCPNCGARVVEVE